MIKQYVWFPSPAGSSYFSMKKDGLHVLKNSCFRPLRGLRISQLYKRNETLGRDVSVPCGVFVFLNHRTHCGSLCLRRFRPLRGLRISQWSLSLRSKG